MPGPAQGERAQLRGAPSDVAAQVRSNECSLEAAAGSCERALRCAAGRAGSCGPVSEVSWLLCVAVQAAPEECRHCPHPGLCWTVFIQQEGFQAWPVPSAHCPPC